MIRKVLMPLRSRAQCASIPYLVESLLPGGADQIAKLLMYSAGKHQRRRADLSFQHDACTKLDLPIGPKNGIASDAQRTQIL